MQIIERNQIEALETLDEFDDTSVDGVVEYQELVSNHGDIPKKLYLNENHPHYNDMMYYAQVDGVTVIPTTGKTKVC